MTYETDNYIKCRNWKVFEEELKKVQQWLDNQEKRDETTFVTSLMYRGQANADWELETSLERFTGEKKYLVNDYYSKIHEASFAIEAFAKKKWKIPGPGHYSDLVDLLRVFTPNKKLFHDDYEIAEYFLYLRHHGFPSPMLDWTSSPYIAAFFAFREMMPSPPKNVSIFVFLESITGTTGRGGKPTINTLGRYIRTHERHFLQQCEYTFCLEEVRPTGPSTQLDSSAEKYFTSHTYAFEERPSHQQYKWKFDIPYTERKEVLKFLDSVNINAFSLFGSLESLMEATAVRHFFVQK